MHQAERGSKSLMTIEISINLLVCLKLRYKYIVVLYGKL